MAKCDIFQGWSDWLVVELRWMGGFFICLPKVEIA